MRRIDQVLYDLITQSRQHILLVTFAAAKIGGVVAIDGVKVSMINRNFPQLKLGSTYLLFISRYSTGGAEIGAGPNGVFTIDVNGKISPLSRSQHPIQRDIETKLDNSLDGLRRYVQKRHGL